VVAQLAKLALFAVLFTDGMHLRSSELKSAWNLPGRALLLGMPMFFGVAAWLAHALLGLPWIEACLVAAVLSPTDPVLAAAVVGRQEIPWRLRHLLNVESGLNDGLALPAVIGLMSVAEAGSLEAVPLLEEIVLGVALGVALPWGAAWIERLRFFSVSKPYGQLFAFAVGLLVLAVTSLLHANEFLAAFAAGVTMASVHPNLREQFREFGENIAELLKLAALLVFGALISPDFLAETDPWIYVFAVLILAAARPVTLATALLGSGLQWRERVVAAWFGPKGFASVTFGLMVYHSGVRDAVRLFHIIALAVVASIVAHSSSDVLVARWLHRTHGAGGRRREAEAPAA
jgi:NhaP-type Na+/H+ or K+/H+ antiporter